MCKNVGSSYQKDSIAKREHFRRIVGEKHIRKGGGE